MLKSSLCAGLDSLLWQSQLYADSWLMAVLAAVGSPVFPGYGMILSLVNGNHISARLSVILYNRTTSLSA